MRRRCSCRTATSRPTPGTTASGRPFQPQVHYFVGGATKMFGAALYRLRKEDFGELRHHDGISPAWPISLRRTRAVLRARRADVSRARAARPGSDRAARQRTLSLPAGLQRAPHFNSCRDNLTAAGYHPFPAPCAIMLERGRTWRTAPASAARPATAFLAWCTPSPTRKPWPCAPPLEFPNVTLLRNAKAAQVADECRTGTAVTEVVADVAGQRDVFRGDIVVVSCGAANSAKLLLMSANDKHPERPCQRLGSGGTQLHVPQQPGRTRDLARAQPDHLPEDDRAE